MLMRQVGLLLAVAGVLLVPADRPGGVSAVGVLGARPAQVPATPAVVPGPCIEDLAGYQVPVAAEVVDRFRPPATGWGPGNRGWEFATVGGEVVCAVGSGVVRFAGWVAGRGVVTLEHADGMLSSLTGLGTLEVVAGGRLEGGEPLGRAAAGLHLGFRVDGAYVDPALVLRRYLHAVLVPVPPALGRG